MFSIAGIRSTTAAMCTSILTRTSLTRSSLKASSSIAHVGMRCFATQTGPYTISPLRSSKFSYNRLKMAAWIGFGSATVMVGCKVAESKFKEIANTEQLASELTAALMKKSIPELKELFASRPEFLNTKIIGSFKSGYDTDDPSIAQGVLSNPRIGFERVDLSLEKRMFLVKQIAQTEESKKLKLHPLHIAIRWDACTLQAKLDLINELIKENPQNILLRDANGYTVAELSMIKSENATLSNYLIGQQIECFPFDKAGKNRLLKAAQIVHHPDFAQDNVEIIESLWEKRFKMKIA